MHTGCGKCCGLHEAVGMVRESRFYNSAISKHVVRARIVVEMGSHPTKRLLFNHTTPFSTKGLEMSLCDFTGTIIVQCENPVIAQHQFMIDLTGTQRSDNPQKLKFSLLHVLCQKSRYEETCNSNVRLHVVSPLVCVLSALKLVRVNTVLSATMATQK